MRVLNPGPGEIVDRLTVVARKIVEGGGEHFTVEHKELVEYYYDAHAQPKELKEGFVTRSILMGLLGATNAAIWQREDELRDLRSSPKFYEVGHIKLAFKIQELNDRRAELVKEINAAAGVVREEKL